MSVQAATQTIPLSIEDGNDDCNNNIDIDLDTEQQINSSNEKEHEREQNKQKDKQTDSRSNVVPLNISSDQQSITPIKNAKCMAVLYIIFLISFTIASIIQFGEYLEFNLLLFVNMIGGVGLLICVIYQFRGGPLKYFWTKRQLYLPLLFHVIDTSSDLGTTYIYYSTYKQFLGSISNDEGEEDEETEEEEPIDINEEEEQQQFATQNLQLFITSIFIILSYRFLSSILVYLFTKKYKLSILQFLDLYIFEVLIKSWQYNKSQPTTIQNYITSLEAYFESFPQLLMNALYIIEYVIYYKNDDIIEDEEGNNNNNILSVLFVAGSGVLSLMSVAHKSMNEDKRYFKADGNIRDISINCKCKGECCGHKICCLNPKYLTHVIYRYCNVFFRVYALMTIWDSATQLINGIGNGYTVICIILIDFIGAVVISSIDVKSINFELIQCIAITPLTTKRRWSSIIAFIWRIFQNVMFLLYIISSFGSIQDFMNAVQNIDLTILAMMCYIFGTIMSIIYFCESIFELRCCCNVMKEYGSISRTFEGIECVQELDELFQFGYILKPDHIKNGDFTAMSDIKSVYNKTIDRFANDDEKQKKIINAWEHINDEKRGNLLHQICQNNTMKDNEKEIEDLLNFQFCY